MKRIISIGLSLVIIVGLYFLVLNVDDNYEIWDGYSTAEIIRTDGTVEKFDSNILRPVNKGESVKLFVDFPIEKKSNCATITFYVYHSVINAYSNDKLIYSYGQEIADAKNMIGAKYVMLKVPEEAWGNQLVFVFDIYENSSFSKLAPLKLYPSVDAYKSILFNSVFSFLISISGIFISILGLSIFLFLSKSNLVIKHGIYIFTFVFLTSLWSFANQGTYILFNDLHIWTQIEYTALFATPIPLILYMYDTEKEVFQRKILLAVTVANSVFFVVATFLHLTKIMLYSTTLPALHALLLVNCGIFVFSIFTRFKTKSKHSKSLMIGVLCLFIFALLDLSRFNILKYINTYIPVMNESIMPFGLFLFIVFLIGAYYNECLNSFIDQNARDNLMKLAYVDTLTNCMTRKAGVLVLEESFSQFIKTSYESSSPIIMMLDIDNFKHINDTYGHDFGDLVLSQVAQTINSEIRDSDSLIRWGGEEFVLIYNHADFSEQDKLSQKILDSVKSIEFSREGKNIAVTVSIGGTIFKIDDNQYSDALKRADLALYHSKAHGKNIYTSYSDALINR